MLYSVTLQCMLLQTCEKACVHITHVWIIWMCHFPWLCRKNNCFPILKNFSHSHCWCLEFKWYLEMRALEYVNTKMIFFLEYLKVCISEFELVSILAFFFTIYCKLKNWNLTENMCGWGRELWLSFAAFAWVVAVPMVQDKWMFYESYFFGVQIKFQRNFLAPAILFESHQSLQVFMPKV